MLAFLEARKGRAVPFWLPSYQWDLTLAVDLLTAGSNASIDWVRYTQQYFGTTGARRHLAIWPHGLPGSMDYYLVEDADDPGTEVTESLTINPGAVQDYPVASTVLSFLKLGRLEDDRVEIEYYDTETAQATIKFRELPLEAPTEAV
jgi:hypothetical protein